MTELWSIDCNLHRTTCTEHLWDGSRTMRSTIDQLVAHLGHGLERQARLLQRDHDLRQVGLRVAGLEGLRERDGLLITPIQILLTALLMGIPAWRQVDRLPVLARSAEDEDDEQDDAARDGADETRPDDLDDAAVAALFDRARGAAGRPESVA